LRRGYFGYYATAMTHKRKAIVASSGGKDSAPALYALQQAGTVDIVALLTTVTEEDNRINIHGVRRDLLRRQAESLSCFLEEIFVPSECPNNIYQSRLQEALKR
jgi:diphthamide synthase (EF-2-diphthine--ammonia ligase)